MHGNPQLPEGKPEATGRRIAWSALIPVGLVLAGIWIWLSPPNSFHPTCTYTVNARVSADVLFSGKMFTAEVVYQNAHSRKWISIMNSAGCVPKYGNALLYKSADDKVLIVSARLCRSAVQEIARTGKVDVLQACSGRQARQDSGFIVDSATQPSAWRMARNGIDFQITRMTATSTWNSPADDIEETAPGLLTSKFEYGRSISVPWSKSPETLITHRRRYDARRHRPNRSFEFEVRYEKF